MSLILLEVQIFLSQLYFTFFKLKHNLENEQNKSEETMQELVKIKAEISEIKPKQMVERIMKSKC